MCRLDLRGTGSSEGIATDEYTPQEQHDICRVIAWLAAAGLVQRHGRDVRHLVVGLQLAPDRLRAPTRAQGDRAIYATDDRYRDDVHYMGGALQGDRRDRLRALHGRRQRAAAGAAVFGPGWREQWARAGRRRRAMASPLARGAGRRPVLAARLGAAGLRPDLVPDDARRRLGRRLHEHRSAASRRSRARSG